MAELDKIDWKQMGVFTTDEANTVRTLALVFGFSLCFFIVFYFANKRWFGHVVHRFAGPESAYFKLSEKDLRQYYSNNCADLHALVAAPMALYTCFCVCQDANIFSNSECLMTPHNAQLYLIAFSTGYVAFDLWLCIAELGYTFASSGDFIAHHIFGIVGALCVLVAGRFNVALSAGNLVSEWTTFPMNHRWRMLKHGHTTGKSFVAINAVFFFGFIYFRLIFMALLMLKNVQIQNSFSIWSDPPLVSYCHVASSTLQVGLYLIQIHWFKQVAGVFMKSIEDYQQLQRIAAPKIPLSASLIKQNEKAAAAIKKF